jgi:DNA repair protein RecO (recombination protein O)
MAVRDISVDALVIRELPHGDHDKILTLLSAEHGRISVIAKGARSMKSHILSSTRAFAYSNFELHRKGDFVWVRDASVISSFSRLERDIETLYISQYIADVCYELSGENLPAKDILRLALNSYFALDSGKYDIKKVKAVFEFRAAVEAGYLPDLSVCAQCGASSAEALYLDVMNGSLKCSSCLGSGGIEVGEADDMGTRRIYVHLPQGALAAMRYIADAPPQKLLSFEIKGDAEHFFFEACETYILNHLERGFSSLNQYHELLRLTKKT